MRAASCAAGDGEKQRSALSNNPFVNAETNSSFW
jgi:hypothetical protein